MLKALVLGGSRFIGYHLTLELLRLGFSVTQFRRGITTPPRRLPDRVVVYFGDRNNPNDLEQIFQKSYYDFVFDFSGYTPQHLLPFTDSFRSSIGHYLFCSTSSVLKLHPPTPYNEDAATILDLSYGGQKRAAELTLLAANRRSNLRVTIFRPQAVIGKYDAGQAQQVFLLLKNKTPLRVTGATLAAKLNVLDVRDLVQAFIKAIKSQSTTAEIFTLANNHPTSLSEFIEICSKISRLRMPPVLIDEEAPTCPWWHNYNLVADTTRSRSNLAIEFTTLPTTLEALWQDFRFNQLRRTLTTHVKKFLIGF